MQSINDVQIENEINWSRKHELSLVHAYARAPYFNDYREFFGEIYQREWSKLLDLNRTILEHLARRIGIEVQFKLSSELGVEGKGTDLLVQVCKRLHADVYLSGSAGRKYLQEDTFRDSGISLRYCSYHPEVYPQLWGDFVPNLSTLDLLFNCGEIALKSRLGMADR